MNGKDKIRLSAIIIISGLIGFLYGIAVGLNSLN